MAVALAACVAIAAIGAPWMAERDVLEAARVFDRRPFEAYDRLDRAAKLNPLADRPPLVEGTIALRYGDLDRADAAFARALDRTPRSVAAALQRGAIASARGNNARALTFVKRAARLAPRDPIAAEALEIVEDGAAIDVQNLSRALLERGQRVTAD